jgi:hypothetical protein
MKNVIAWVLVGPLLFLTLIWYGFALSGIWGWFVVPVFAAPVVNTWQAAGLMLVVSSMRLKLGKSSEPDLQSFLVFLLSPALILLVGYAFKHLT